MPRGTSQTVAALAGTADRPTQEAAKLELLSWISGTGRGSKTTKQLRGQIEEAQVAVESFAGSNLDYRLLEGKWLLQYTTAPDVLPWGLTAPVSIGNVYQQFSSVAEGQVQNIIQFSVPFLVEDNQGITFTVGARYDVRSGHRIAFTFEEAELGQVRISPSLEALLAPALLPRGSLNQQLLLAIKEFKLVFPFRSAQQVAQGPGVGANYLLTYLDEDLLVGRASGTAGSFIFTRASEDDVATGMHKNQLAV
eukprot:gene13356-13484_t